MISWKRRATRAVPVVLAGALLASAAQADFLINDDLVVYGSACVGFDCENNEAFAFDTIRLKENNLRLKFDDTSELAEFPRNDWQIIINDSANGGLSRFSIEDVTDNRLPFTIEAGAFSHSIYVRDDRRVGLGTSTPVVELHMRDGNTPTVRLDQDGSSGYPAQVWDVAGNEVSFFIRDASRNILPFRIRAGAPPSSLDIAPDGDAGFGTESPDAALHVERQDTAVARVESTNEAGPTGLEIHTAGRDWSLLAEDVAGAFTIRDVTATANRLTIDADGHTFVGASGSAVNAPVSALTSVNTDPGNLAYAALLENRANIDGTTYAALGFSANSATVPKSAILHQRTGTGGTGRLHFALSAAADDATEVSQADIRMSIDERGNVGIGGSTFGAWDAGLHLYSGATPPDAAVGGGVILYAHRDIPAGDTHVELKVRDEAGNLSTLSPHNFAGYTPDPGDPFPWSYHGRNEFLGEELWADMSGAIRALEDLTGRTFIHRRRIPRADWDAAKRAEAEAAREQQVLRKMGETVEVAPEDAVERVAIMREVESETPETVYSFDRKTGKVVATRRTVMVQEPTGEMEHRIKPGVRLDPRTGRFFRNKTRAEAEAEVPPAQPKPMPQWMAERLGTPLARR